jgi:glucosamine--fructose-6-phosphate aminotransferase (isomerizing)
VLLKRGSADIAEDFNTLGMPNRRRSMDATNTSPQESMRSSTVAGSESKPLLTSRLAQDIQDQATALSCVLTQCCGDGLPPILKAAELLESGRQVLITGIGASMFASIALQYCLWSRGIAATLIEAAEVLHYCHAAYSDAIFIVVSRSGESIEITRLLSIVKRRRQPIIAVTNQPTSTLAREADMTLNLNSPPDEMVAVQTYTGTLLTLYALVSAMDHRLEQFKEEVNTIIPELPEWISGLLQKRDSWDSFLRVDTPIYLLARGASYASASEGALLFNEIAKIPAVGMLTASFRHGPVELVDRSFRGLIFAPQGRTQVLNLALAHDLLRFGGKVRIVGPTKDDASTIDHCPVLAVPELLTPLVEIIPVQIAALRMAELRDIPPGSFRYTPQVAIDEESFVIV